MLFGQPKFFMKNLTTEKLEKLKESLQNMQKAAVAFSGGVDSTFLLKVARDVLGDNAVAVTVRSCLVPHRELAEAENFCKSNGIRQLFIDAKPLEIPGFDENPQDRCYICKRSIFQQIVELAARYGIAYVCEGSNADDTKDYRPGMKAVSELGIKSPLREAALAKAEIRELSKAMKLETWNKPSFACLASRFVYGEKIDEASLKMVEAAEQFLLDSGFTQMRVRVHGKMARIEVPPQDFPLMLENAAKINGALKGLGFSYVTMDLQGYRTGSMNEAFYKGNF